MEATEKTLCDDLIAQLRQYKKDAREFVVNHKATIFNNPNFRIGDAINECDRLIKLLHNEQAR